MTSSEILSPEIKVKTSPELGKPWSPRKVKKNGFHGTQPQPRAQEIPKEEAREGGKRERRQGKGVGGPPAELTMKVENYK